MQCSAVQCSAVRCSAVHLSYTHTMLGKSGVSGSIGVGKHGDAGDIGGHRDTRICDNTTNPRHKEIREIKRSRDI